MSTVLTAADRIRAATVVSKARMLIENVPDPVAEPHRRIMIDTIKELGDLVQAMETRIAQLENDLLRASRK